MPAARAIISGRVQGVGFRAWVADEAAARGLAGWVRNRRNGTVEAVFAGAEDRVADMLDACREGPPGAAVSAVRSEPSDEPTVMPFRILPTA